MRIGWRVARKVGSCPVQPGNNGLWSLAVRALIHSEIARFCPLADSCVALQKGLVDVLPRKQHKTKVSNRYFLYFYIDAGGDTFLHKREAGDIWHNLYEFPLIETGRAMEEEEVCVLPAYRQLFAECEILSVRLVAKQVKHVLSHRVIYADCYVVRIAPGGMPQGAFQCVRSAICTNLRFRV